MNEVRHDEPGLFLGVYSYPEAARLLNVTPRRVKRWADGYGFQLKYGFSHSRPVLQTRRHEGVLTFEELWELFFVREYVAFGVALPQVRMAAEALAEEFGPFPFSNAKLLVNGRDLLVEGAGRVLMRPDIGQLVADFALDMAKQVDIREDQVGRYHPEEFGRVIYLDREIRGGEAVVSEFAIPTRVIFALWEQEKDIAAVADYHEISPQVVSAAVRYEGQWRLAA